MTRRSSARGQSASFSGGARWPDSPFRWMWAASATSLLGSEVGELAIPLFALLFLGADAADLALVRVSQFVPFLVLTLAVGVYVDRVRRRPLLITADLGRGVILAVIVVIAIWGSLPIWGLALAALLVGSLTVLYQLADFAFLPVVVPRDHLASANARLSATQSTMTVAGSGIGGFVVQAFTAPVAVAFNAVAYLLSAAFLTRVRAQEPKRDPLTTPRISAWAEAKEGFGFVARNRVVRALVGEAATWNFFNEILLLGLTLHVIDVYSNGPIVLGALFVLAGLGAVAGASLSSRATSRFGYGRSLTTTLIVGNTAPLLFALSSNGSAAAFTLYATAMALSGFGIGLANAQAVTVRQLATAPDLRGRVNAAYRFLSWGMIALGAVAAGFVATSWGGFAAMIVGAAGTTLASLWIILSPVRTLTDLQLTPS